MKAIIFYLLLVATAFSANAQNKKIDLTSDPNKPVITNKSNAQLLNEAREEPVKNNDSTGIKPNVSIPTAITPNSSSQIDENGQRLNTRSTQMNIGNKKATSTIHYDNSGKVKSTGTSIQLGK